MERTGINDDESPSVFYNVEPPNNISNVEEQQTDSDIYQSVASLIAIHNLISTSKEQDNLLSFNIFYSPKQEHLCNIIYLHLPSSCFTGQNSIFKPQHTNNAIIANDNQGGFFLNITALQKILPYCANNLLITHKNNLLEKLNVINNQITL